MSSRNNVRDVIITAREVRKIFTGGQETVSRTLAAAVEDPWELGACLGLLSEAQRQLDEATDRADPDVMVVTQHQFASVLQSYLQELGPGEAAEAPLVEGGKELKFQDGFAGRDLGWVRALRGHVGLVRRHPMLRPASDRADLIPNAFRMAILGDWGTGLYGARPAIEHIAASSTPYDILLHLGDIYYTGTEAETRDRFLNLWPTRDKSDPRHSRIVSRALNGNHEMYSGGYSYFDILLPALEQEASYFAFQNDYWTLIALDTGYLNGGIDETQSKWLVTVAGEAGDRRVVLFSHHNYYAMIGPDDPVMPGTLRALCNRQGVFAWYFGHDHRCIFFDKRDEHSFWARCIGHSGIPYLRRDVADAPASIQGKDWSWRRASPNCQVLDGPNPYIPQKEKKFGPNGYLVLEFNGPNLNETVRLPDGTEIWNKPLA